MPTLQSISPHSGLLSNPCAEFVEKGAGLAAVRSVAAGSDDLPVQEPVYSKEHDRVEKIYESSKECMQRFRDTMKKFTEMLQQRKEFRRLGIEIRDPDDYDAQYVLDLANTLMQKSENPGEFGTFQRFAMMCVRGYTKGSEVFRGLLELIPTDVYGSLISGGLTLAFAAIEHVAKQHQIMRDALTELPKTLSRVQRLSEAHKKSAQLHGRANSVLVSTFGVLQSIISRLSMSNFGRVRAKFKGGESVDDAMTQLNKDVDDFHRELEVCKAYKLARHEENLEIMDRKLDDIKVLCENVAFENSKEYRIKDRGLQQMNDHMVLTVFNKIYSFLGADKQFDPATGQIITQYPNMSNKRRLHQDLMKEVARNQRFLKTLLSQFDDGDATLDAQVKELLTNTEQISLEDKDKLQYIIESDLFQGWLGETKSGALTINTDTPPDDVINYVSINTAMLYATLNSKVIKGRFAVLGYFCGMRAGSLPSSSTRRGGDQPSMGLLGMLKSLNRQILHFISEENPYEDVSALVTKDMVEQAMTSRNAAMKLLGKLLSLLPEDGVVVVLLDSMSRLKKEAPKGDVFVDFLIQLMEDLPQLNMKLLVTDCLPNSSIRRVCRSLWIPDDVDGWRLGINTKSLAERNLARFEEGVGVAASGSSSRHLAG